MPISRAQLQQLFLKDAERARGRREQALERIKTAPTGEGRLGQIATGALGGFLTGGPAGAVAGGVGGAIGKGDPLETFVKGGLGGVTAKGIPADLGKAATLENIPRALSAVKTAGAGSPLEAIQELQTFSKSEANKLANIAKEKAEILRKKAEKKEEREFKKEESQRERTSRERLATTKLTAQKERQIEQDIIKARSDAEKAYEKLKKKPKNKELFIEDKVQSIIKGKFPEFKDVKGFLGLKKKVRTGNFLTTKESQIKEAKEWMIKNNITRMTPALKEKFLIETGLK